jgi:hypothetical protein
MNSSNCSAQSHVQNANPKFVASQFSKSIPGLLLLALFVAPFTANAQTAVPDKSSHSTGWVVLSLDDYRALRSHAYPSDYSSPPPVDATLSRVDYDLGIVDSIASGRATLTVDVLKDGWVKVPIPPGLIVREARLDGKLVSLIPQSGQLSALLSKPGRTVLQLDIAFQVAISAGEESITLPATSSGVTRATVNLPRQGIDVRLTGGLLSDKSESSNDSKWVAYSRGNTPLTFTWHRKVEDHHATLPLRMRSALTELVGLGEDNTSINVEVNLTVNQGVARETKLQIPDKITVNQVLGASIADWEIKSGELTVTFLEPVEQSTRFVITAETRLPRDGQMDIPLLRVLNTEHETGGIAVEVLGAGEIKDVKSEGLENADASDLGELISSRQSPSLAAFRFRANIAPTRALAVNVARYTPQAVLMANVEEARYNVLITKEGKTLVQARYAVRNNQRNFLKITLPPGATLWSASLSGNPVRPGQSPDGALLLPLEKARAGEDAPLFAVEVLYISRDTAWTEKGQSKLTLPALDLPISRTGLHVFNPPLFRVTSSPGTFRSQNYEDPSSEVLRPDENLEVDGKMDGGYGNGRSSASSPGAGVAAGDMAASGAPNIAPAQTTQTLVDEYRAKSVSGRISGIIPIHVNFPEVGPSLYFVSELTSESQAPTIELTYQRDKKAGGK